MERPRSQTPFWLDLVPLVGNISGAIRNKLDNPMAHASTNRQSVRYDGQIHVVASRCDAHNIAAQFLLEYFAPPGAATRLVEDTIHDMPPTLIELIERMWEEPCQN
eukprot:6052214-Pyramimonas_sp.AAC.1